MRSSPPLESRLEWVLVAAACVAHLALYWLPQINLEWAFSDALLYFHDGDARRIDRYFAVQANTLGLSYSSFLVSKLLPGLDATYVPRLLSSLGILALGSALIRFGRMLELNRSDSLLVMLVLINPVVWIYSGRGTADFLPTALVLFSVSLFWGKTTGLSGYATAIITFSLAILLKYHAALLLPILWIEALSRANVDYKAVLLRLLATSALVLIGPCLYVFLMRDTFGFWITPPVFQKAFQVSVSSFATNLVSYLGYLSLLLLPLTLLSLMDRLLNPRTRMRLVLLLTAVFLVGYVALNPEGEMNFGPFDRYLNEKLVYGFLCVCAGLLILVLQDCFRAHKHPETRRLLACIAAGIVFFLAMLSLTRPAQRYLLFVLPFAYYFLTIHAGKRKILVGATILLMASINVYVAFSQYATGSASRELVQKLEASGLIADTSPEIILGHVGNEFPFSGALKKKYIVVEGHRPDQLLSAESSPIPFVRRVYAVIPNPQY